MVQPYSGNTWGEWLVSTNDVGQLWKAQPTYVITQVVYVIGGIITFIHALTKGGRWPWFWLATVLHGLYADNFFHFVLPEYDNFWHSMTPIMFLGARLPLHIILLYPMFMYNAVYAVSKLNLPRYAEPFAAGLLVVLIDIPYDLVGAKFLHWTWHDTDPNIFDRMYYVPWNSYYFHATFTASLVFVFDASRRWMAPKVAKWDSAGKKVELKALMISAILGMPGGVLLFVPLYHPLHDMFFIHSELTYYALVSIFLSFIIVGLISERNRVKDKLTRYDYTLLAHLAIHYLTYWFIVALGHPEREWSLGLHEPVGPCHESATLTTPFGQKLYKRRYLCLDDYDEPFDFRCVDNKRPVDGASWYLICGTPFQNRMEYVTLETIILIMASAVFYSIYFRTAAPTSIQPVKEKKYK